MLPKKTNSTDPGMVAPKSFNSILEQIMENAKKIGLPDSRPIQSDCCIRVENRSSQTLYPLDILPLGSIGFPPEESGSSPNAYTQKADFVSELWFLQSTAPTSDTKLNFGVVQEMLLPGQIGWVQVVGVAAVKFKLKSGISAPGENMRASIRASDYNFLELNNSTGAEVLYVCDYASTSGEYYGLINLGRQFPQSFIPAKAQAAIAGGASGNIKEMLADGTVKGDAFSATNLSSNAVESGDYLVFGNDREGNAFFLPVDTGGCSESGTWTVEWELFLCDTGSWVSQDTGKLCFDIQDICSPPFGAGLTESTGWTGDTDDISCGWTLNYWALSGGNSIEYKDTGAKATPGTGGALFAQDGSDWYKIEFTAGEPTQESCTNDSPPCYSWQEGNLSTCA